MKAGRAADHEKVWDEVMVVIVIDFGKRQRITTPLHRMQRMGDEGILDEGMTLSAHFSMQSRADYWKSCANTINHTQGSMP